MTDDDVQKWIARADGLLRDYATAPTDHGGIPVPDDLAALKILRVDVKPPDYVGFVWLGGLDHTELVIRRAPLGTYTVTARYNDETERQLWPKEDAKAAVGTP